MTIALFSRNASVPTSFSVDLSVEPSLQSPGPFRVSLVAWTDTSAATAGFLLFSMTYRAPNAVANDVLSPVITGNLNLADAAGYLNTTVETIQRLSSTSLWTLDVTLAGVASTSLFGCRLLIDPIDTFQVNVAPVVLGA